MKLWLIAIWRTIPRRWLVVATPIVLPLFALLLWFLLAGLFAEPINPQEVAFAAELERLRPLATKGDPRALYRAAVIQRDGLTGTTDLRAAFVAFDRAARKGYIPAQHALGDLYAGGRGVRQDYQRAAQWYKLAAGLGRNSAAQFALGELYYYGRGVGQDFGEAIRWYRRAAESADPAAQFILASMYEKGWGVDVDFVEAYIWYGLAAAAPAPGAVIRGEMDPAQALANLTKRMSRIQRTNAKKRLRAANRRVRK